MSGTAEADNSGGVTKRFPLAILAVLLLANIFNFVDRQLPYILAEQIKHDLSLSDTQLGLLGGAAFAVVYAIVALPLGHLADRHGSRWVLSGCIFIWSAMTSIGGLAQNYGQLALSRCGVAVGEAGATPSALAVISSHFPLTRRALPMAIFSLGVPFGTMIGLVLGGWLGEVMSWRFAFVIVAAPGLALATACAVVLRPPPAAKSADTPTPEAAERATEAEDYSIFATVRFMVRSRALRHIFAAVTIFNTGAYATIAFTPPFYSRAFGMTSAQVGLSLGLVHGIAGTIGALTGGWLGDRLGAQDIRWRLWVPAIGLLIAIPFTATSWLASSFAVSIACFAAPKFANLLYLAPTFATVHAIVPARIRATASAVMYFGMGLFGMSLGPLFVGMASDALKPHFGDASLRYALLLVIVTQAWAALHFYLAARNLRGQNEAVCA